MRLLKNKASMKELEDRLLHHSKWKPPVTFFGSVFSINMATVREIKESPALLLDASGKDKGASGS